MTQSSLPTYPSTLLGYRLFRVNRGELFALADPAREPYSVVSAARCKRAEYSAGAASAPGELSEHPAPHPDCSCGIYAYHTRALAWNHQLFLNQYRAPRPSSQIPAGSWVLAAVAGRGRAEIYSKGWRAAEIQVLAFERPKWLEVSDEELGPHCLRLGPSWDLPILPDLESYAERLAQPAPQGLLPEGSPTSVFPLAEVEPTVDPDWI